MSATHRQGLGPVVGDLFLDSDVPACERVTVSRNGWSAEVTHLWTGHGWTRLVPGPVHRVPAQPLVTRSTQPPVSSPVGTRKRSSKKAAPPAPLQPAARRVPVRQVRPTEPAPAGRPTTGTAGLLDAVAHAADTPAAELLMPRAPTAETPTAEAPTAEALTAEAPAVDDAAAAEVVLPDAVEAPAGPTGEPAQPPATAGGPVDVTLPATPVVPRQPVARTPDPAGGRRNVRHAARR